MTVTAFRTVRARLLALMVLVTLPIAVIAAITATVTYRSVLASVEASQIQTVGNFAVRTRIWYRETLRSLLTAVAGVTATERTDADCAAIVRRIVGDGLGFNAIAMATGSGTPCRASSDASFDMARLDGIMQAFRQRPRTAAWTGADLADSRYGFISAGARRYLGVYARREGQNGQAATEALLLADAAILDRSFDLGSIAPGVIVALVQQPGGIVISRGAEETDRTWLPGREMIGTAVQRWEDLSRSGVRAAFASQLVAEPDLYVLSRFDQSAERAAFLQFIALLLTPLVTLAVLFAAYSLAIDHQVIRWVRGIEAAAVARASQQPRLAPVDPSMPDDILRVSEAFNALVSEQAERVEKLNLTVGANRYLVRELHHRVKNSLQVVQSYLSLARRQHGPEHRIVLAEVEAKVQVLSIAYRHALAQGEMRPVELKPFLEEIAVMLDGLLGSEAPGVAIDAPADMALIVDRAIPLGLLVVEIAGHALRETGSSHIVVCIRPCPDNAFLLEIGADTDQSAAADTRIAQGLFRQLEATRVHAADGRSLGQWQVRT